MGIYLGHVLMVSQCSNAYIHQRIQYDLERAQTHHRLIGPGLGRGEYTGGRLGVADTCILVSLSRFCICLKACSR